MGKYDGLSPCQQLLGHVHGRVGHTATLFCVTRGAAVPARARRDVLKVQLNATTEEHPDLGQTSGKHMSNIRQTSGKIWQTSGKHMSNIRQTSGKIWQTYGKHLVADKHNPNIWQNLANISQTSGKYKSNI